MYYKALSIYIYIRRDDELRDLSPLNRNISSPPPPPPSDTAYPTLCRHKEHIRNTTKPALRRRREHITFCPRVPHLLSPTPPPRVIQTA